MKRCFRSVFFIIFLMIILINGKDVNALDYQCVYDDVTLIKTEKEIVYSLPSGYGLNSLSDDIKFSEFSNTEFLICPDLDVSCNNTTKECLIKNNIVNNNVMFITNDLSEPEEDIDQGIYDNDVFDHTDDTLDCDVLFGNVSDDNSVAWLINTIYGYIKIVSPTILIIFTGIDFIKIILLGDDELNKKMKKRLIMRIGILVCIFLIPMIVGLLLEVFGMQGCIDLFV